MNIGIITQPLHTNYGGLLQNYALQKVLKDFGHKTITLDHDLYGQATEYRFFLQILKTIILRSIGKGKHRLYIWEIKKIRKNTEYFINKYITRTCKINSSNAFQKYARDNNIDVFVVGSDQVWRPKYNKNVLNSFLNFAVNLQVKRIAYAASFGVEEWEFNAKQTAKILELIKLFDAVSVREDSGIILCKEFLNCEAVHVLDPTMLLDKEDYIALINRENALQSKGNLFTYILDETIEKKEIINNISKKLKLKTFSSMPQHHRDIYPPVTQWLRSFMDAEFIICDSFHGAVFSIIFNKPFLIIGNKERGISRFNSLLKMFNLKDRMINIGDNYNSIINKSIDWENINTLRDKWKEKSLNYIYNNLSI